MGTANTSRGCWLCQQVVVSETSTSRTQSCCMRLPRRKHGAIVPANEVGFVFTCENTLQARKLAVNISGRRELEPSRWETNDIRRKNPPRKETRKDHTAKATNIQIENSRNGSLLGPRMRCEGASTTPKSVPCIFQGTEKKNRTADKETGGPTRDMLHFLRHFMVSPHSVRKITS